MLRLFRRIRRRFESRLPTKLRIRLWQSSQRLLRLKYDATNRSALFWIVAIPLLSIVSALVTNAVVAGFLKPGVLGDVLIGTATLIGGFLTTAFALSVSLQQSVADLYSPQHLTGYAFGRVQRISFAFISTLILLCLSLGIYAKTLIPIEPFDAVRIVGLVLGFLAIGASLGALGWQLQQGGEALRPASAIGFLRDRAFRHLKVIQENAARLGTVSSFLRAEQTGRVQAQGPVLSIKRQRLANAYGQLGETPGRALLMQLAPFIDIGIRLSDRADALGTEQAIAAWSDVFRRYLVMRRYTTWLKPSSVFGAIEPDNSSALHRAFEQFNDLGVRVLKNRQPESARQIVRVYDQIIAAAFRIKYVNMQRENPVAETASGYLRNFVRVALAEDDFEVAFASVPVFERYGLSAIDYGLSHASYSVCKYLDEIAPYSFKPSFEILAKPCTDAYRSLIWAFLFSDAPSHGVDRVLESLKKYHALSAAHYWSTRGSGAPTMALEAVRAPFEDLVTVVEGFIVHYRRSQGTEQRQYRVAFLQFARDASSLVRSAVETLTMSNGYADLVPKLIVSVAACLSELREQFSTQTAGESASGWVYLLTWTGHKLQSPDGDTLSAAAEYAAYAAMIAVHRADADMRDASIESHASIVRRQLKTTGALLGYDEPRAIARLALVAAFALKTRQWALLQLLVIKVRELEREYEDFWKARASGLRPTSVAAEFESLGQYVTARASLMFGDPPLAHAAQLIDQNDMDHLAWFVWRRVRKYSRFASEFPERQKLNERIVALLKVPSLRLVTTLRELSAHPAEGTG